MSPEHWEEYMGESDAPRVPLHKEHIMVLNEVARQTLRYNADKLFGRTKGELTDAEVDSLRVSRQYARTKEKDKDVSEDKDNKSIHLNAQWIVSIDSLLQFMIPHWKDYDKHLQVLSNLLHEVSKKGAEQYERDLIEAQQLAEEYNQRLDEQLWEIRWADSRLAYSKMLKVYLPKEG